ncbi:MAG: glycosyltransferase 87 family protein [Actinomycetota bacterium]|nr:glycosyltransferase 87 family protein [Actinomycetota bacterium]
MALHQPIHRLAESMGLSATQQFDVSQGYDKGRFLSNLFLALSIASTAGLLFSWRFSQQRSVAFMVVAASALAAIALIPALSRHLTERKVLVTSGFLLVLAVIVPPIASHDLWSYATYGRMLAHYHVSPYTHTPSQFPADPLSHLTFWRTYSTVYGPLFTLLSAGIMSIVGISEIAIRLVFQSMAALATLAALLTLRKRVPPAALAFIGLSPMVIVSAVNGGHNDVLVGLIVLWAVLLLGSERSTGAAVLLGTAALIKVSVLVAIGASILWVWRRSGLKDAFKVTAISGAMLGVGYWTAGGFRALEPLSKMGHRVSRDSMWELIRRFFRTITVTKPQSWPVMMLALFFLATIFVIVLARQRDAAPTLAVGSALVVYTLIAPYVLPWYLMWALPVLALEWRSAAARVAFAQTSFMLVTYIYQPAKHLRPFARSLKWTISFTQMFEVTALLLLLGFAGLELRNVVMRLHQAAPHSEEA